MRPHQKLSIIYKPQSSHTHIVIHGLTHINTEDFNATIYSTFRADKNIRTFQRYAKKDPNFTKIVFVNSPHWN